MISDNKIKVPFFVPHISKKDKNLIMKSLGNQSLTDGPCLKTFESDFRKFSNSKYAIGVSNATAALFLSLKSLGIKKMMK